MSMRVAIVDYGMGNLASVSQAFATLGAAPAVAATPSGLTGADAIVLPGVGSFARAMANLTARGFADSLTDRVIRRGVPFLGICLGMQLLARRSPEGGVTDGLGWIDADVVPLASLMTQRLPVPHVGWNRVSLSPKSGLFVGQPEDATLYFDHEYAIADAGAATAATCRYGATFCAAIERGNLFAVQFHPEKSQRAGLKLLRRFLEAAGDTRRDAA
ncbi:MAG: imidazole glycerol phosphate synthase subunit HisH [Acetobacterales bacterium]